MNFFKFVFALLSTICLLQTVTAQGSFTGTIVPAADRSNGTFITFTSTTQFTPNYSTYRLVFYRYSSIAPSAPLSQCIMPLPCTENNVSTSTFRTVNSSIALDQLVDFCNATSTSSISGTTSQTTIRFSVYLQRYDYQTCNTCNNAANCRLTAVNTLDARYITYILSYGNVNGSLANAGNVTVISDTFQTPITYVPTSTISLCNPANANVDSVQLTNSSFAAICIRQTIENFVTPLNVSCSGDRNITLSLKFSSGPNTFRISTPFSPCNAPSTFGSVIPSPSVETIKTNLQFSSIYTTSVFFYLVLTTQDIALAGISTCTSASNCLVPPSTITLSSIIYGMNPLAPFSVEPKYKLMDSKNNKRITPFAGIPYDLPNSNTAAAVNSLNLSFNKTTCLSKNCTAVALGSSDSDSCDSRCKVLAITFSLLAFVILTLCACYKCNINGAYGDDDNECRDKKRRCDLEMETVNNRNRI